MNELLFKLKKGGQCVGYMRIRLEPNHGLRMQQEYHHPRDDEWFPRNIRDLLSEADSIHPFVCRDRHGKDCFEGDQVYISLCGESQGTGEAVIRQKIALPLSDYTRDLSPYDYDIELIDAKPQAQASSDAEQGKG